MVAEEVSKAVVEATVDKEATEVADKEATEDKVAMAAKEDKAAMAAKIAATATSETILMAKVNPRRKSSHIRLRALMIILTILTKLD